jgi:hypothetical protein
MKISPFLMVCVVFSFVESAVYAVQFGFPGQNGSNGRQGARGRNGVNTTIIADGSYGQYDLRGEDGYYGQDGWNGGDAGNCFQPLNVDYNLIGAPGGQGGDGGWGGGGGDGGDSVVYFERLSDLRGISIDASGGRGATGGRFGAGGYGCRCFIYNWRVNGNTYSCFDGYMGRQGSPGQNGRDGALGSVKLIPQLEPLPVEEPSKTVGLLDLADRDQSIFQYIWSNRSGARSLFAPGSRISDFYVELSDTQRTNFSLDWRAPVSISQFAEARVLLSYRSGVPAVTFSDDIWPLYSLRRTGEETKIEVDDAVSYSDVKSLRVEGFTGSGRDLSVILLDDAPDSSLDTTFQVSYYTRGLAVWKLRYQGGVDPAVISKVGNRYTVNIGRLNIHPDFLQRGVSFLMQLSAKRTLGSKSLTLQYERQHQIQ